MKTAGKRKRICFMFGNLNHILQSEGFMKQVNVLSQQNNNQKMALPGLRVSTHTRAGTEASSPDPTDDQAATCQQCIQGWLSAISQRWGIFG